MFHQGFSPGRKKIMLKEKLKILTDENSPQGKLMCILSLKSATAHMLFEEFCQKIPSQRFQESLNQFSLPILILPIIFEIRYFIWQTNLRIGTLIETYREIEIGLAFLISYICKCAQGFSHSSNIFS